MVYHETQPFKVNKTFLTHLCQISLILDQKLRLFQLRPQMDGYISLVSQWHSLQRKNTFKVNGLSYNHHFTRNGDWYHVPIMVSMVTDLKLKNAISQLLIKLETCGFQYLHLHFQLLMILLDENLNRENGQNTSYHPLCKCPYCAKCTAYSN